MLSKIRLAIEKIDSLSKTKPIRVISHYDSDGITLDPPNLYPK